MQTIEDQAKDAARAWLHAYGINTKAYTDGGGDHPAMHSLPEAFIAFSKSAQAENATLRLTLLDKETRLINIRSFAKIELKATLGAGVKAALEPILALTESDNVQP